MDCHYYFVENALQNYRLFIKKNLPLIVWLTGARPWWKKGTCVPLWGFCHTRSSKAVSVFWKHLKQFLASKTNGHLVMIIWNPITRLKTAHLNNITPFFFFTDNFNFKFHMQHYMLKLFSYLCGLMYKNRKHSESSIFWETSSLKLYPSSASFYSTLDHYSLQLQIFLYSWNLTHTWN